jgi:hypothetical protein
VTSTCDEARALLPEHLLGTLEEEADEGVRRHLRGCASCRAEMAALGEGIATFARAAHDRPPPDGLKDRVMTVLGEEWREQPVAIPAAGGRARLAWAAAAAAAVLVAALAWGGVQTRRASVAAADAGSYRNLLEVLGGEEFRLGELSSEGPDRLEGSVVLYDSHVDQSWVVVLVRAPGMFGTATATLEADDGRSIEMRPLEFGETGSAATWWVGPNDLRAYDHVEIARPDGTLLAATAIVPA